MTLKTSKYRSRRPPRTHKPMPAQPLPPLGVAGHMARFFIDSPLSPLLMLATLFIGVLALVFTPRQEDPQISVPMIDIFVQYPGASAEQVSNLAISPLERIMKEIPGVEYVYSTSRREQGLVTVRYFVGEPLGPSIVKVHDRLQQNLDRIPPGVSMPLVKPKSVDDVPVVTVTLWSQEVDDAALRALANDVLQRLSEVPDAGQGFVVGGRREQIRVEVSPEQLSGFGISLDQVAETIRSANLEQGSGLAERGSTLFKVSAGSFLTNAQGVAKLVVGSRFGSPIYLQDVARVYEGPEETDWLVDYFSGPAQHAVDPRLPDASGASAVTIAIAKREGTNGVTVAGAILERLELLKGRLIPDTVEVTVTRNYGKTANDKVNELLAAMWWAAVAVSVLCWVTLGGRPAVVVITVIPLVILITIWTAWVLDFTIDRVSLFALIFSIGILVDDATVVVENIYRRWLHEGQTGTPTAVDAVREVGNPTIMANFTIFAALLPMGFVSGLMGPYMLPIPILGTAAAFFSVVFAFVFTPWVSRVLRPRMAALERAERREARAQRLIGKMYRPLVEPLIRHRTLAWAFLTLILVAFFAACVLFYTRAVTVKMLPFDNKSEFDVVVEMPEGSALPVTANLTWRLAEALRRLPEVTALQTYVGTASPFNFNGMVRHYYLRDEPWQADIQVMLTDKGERERSSHEIASAARELLAPIAREGGGRIQTVEMPPGPPVLQTVVAEIHGPDPEIRRQVATEMTELFEAVPNLVDVDNLMAASHDRWHFAVDTEKAVRRNVSVETILHNIAMAMGGYELGDIKRGSVLEPIPIVIQIPRQIRSDIHSLADLPIRSADGSVVPLSELGQFLRIPEDPIIYRKDLRPVEYVVGEMAGRLGAPIYGMLGVEELLQTHPAPDGVVMSGTLTGAPDNDLQSGFEWAGEWTVTYETFRDLGLSFCAALLLIYILLVWEFRSFSQALVVMAPIPLTLIGIIPGHWLLNAEFTATSMIGFIALAGIEVRNSILMVDFTKNELENGVLLERAVVNAGHIRFRPIWVTDLTMMAGSFALIFDPIFQGMAISLLFGPVVSTSLTLLVVPLGCISVGRSFRSGCAGQTEEERTALAAVGTGAKGVSTRNGEDYGLRPSVAK
jgi:multidrug efflux pump subunit AcrB